MKLARLLALVLAAITLTGCSVNPVTGKRQLNFYSEEDEIAMGAEADQGIVAQYGMLADEDLQAYVSGIGERMVPVSHRPNLDFHFRVLDDPIVNAFALPGGYVYITRGILAYLDNEAALAGVMGHEIGHVTAQHGVTQMSSQSIIGLGVSMGAAVAHDIPFVGDIANTGAQLLFLKYGRDDERQSDQLGVEYATALSYDTRQMANFFQSLDRLSGDNGGLPGWMSTHPDPGERWETVTRLTTEAQHGQPGPFVIHRDAYLDHIDGIVFGQDPREGFFSERFFHHPGMHFRFPVPEGWQGQNTRSAVGVFAPEQKAVFILGPAQGESVEAAASKWLGNEGVETIRTSATEVAGAPARRTEVRVPTEQGTIHVVSTFFERDRIVFVMHGYAVEADFATYGDQLVGIMDGFAEETDPEVLGVQPVRVEIVALDRAMDFGEFAQAHPVPEAAHLETVEGLAILNTVRTTAQLEAGRRMKVLVQDTP
jgi:predicted Zn-dependent protease